MDAPSLSSESLSDAVTFLQEALLLFAPSDQLMISVAEVGPTGISSLIGFTSNLEATFFALDGIEANSSNIGNISLALDESVRFFLMHGRVEAAKSLVVLSSGQVSPSNAVAFEASRVNLQSTPIFSAALGYGDVQTTNLVKIAGSEERVLLEGNSVGDFRSLLRVACSEGGCVPHSTLEVLILIDGSESVLADDFAHLKAYASSLVSSFLNNSPNTTVTLNIAEYSSSLQVVDPAFSGDGTELQTRIDSLIQSRGLTNIAASTAEAATSSLFWGPSTTSKLIVLITDGLPSFSLNAEVAVRALQRRGIQFFGVGPEVVIPYLTTLGGNPSFTFQFEDLTEVSMLRDALVPAALSTCINTCQDSSPTCRSDANSQVLILIDLHFLCSTAIQAVIDGMKSLVSTLLSAQPDASVSVASTSPFTVMSDFTSDASTLLAALDTLSSSVPTVHLQDALATSLPAVRDFFARRLVAKQQVVLALTDDSASGVATEVQSLVDDGVQLLGLGVGCPSSNNLETFTGDIARTRRVENALELTETTFISKIVDDILNICDLRSVSSRALDVTIRGGVLQARTYGTLDDGNLTLGYPPHQLQLVGINIRAQQLSYFQVGFIWKFAFHHCCNF